MNNRLRLKFGRRVAYGIFATFLATTHVSGALGSEPKFHDPLDYPAQVRSSLATRPLVSVARAGDGLVAVGLRGLIIYSGDNGKSWEQSSVPVQSDLLAVHFADSQIGWVVGHDGVILNTRDGGKTWTKQLDGRVAAKAFTKFYAADGRDAAMEAAAARIVDNFRSGPSLPYLDVWFEDDMRGFVVGSFGMIAATADGGKAWTPWLHRIDNDQLLNLNSIEGIGGDIYIAGEGGLVYKLDRDTQRFEKIVTGYAGSFFGITGNAETLLAFGLRGVVYRSGDGGKTWESINMPTDATISGSALLTNPDGFVFVNAAGQYLWTDRTARRFEIVKPEKPMRYTGIALAEDHSWVVSGMEGVRKESAPITSR